MNTQTTEPTVFVSLTVKNASEALDFYTRAFNAQELFRLPMPNGEVAHAEFMLGNTKMSISGESPEFHAFAMPENTKASCLFAIATESCDKSYEQATAAGAEGLSSPEDQFWGTRIVIIKDPYGYRWSFSEIIEEVSPEEMARRAQKLFEG